MALLRAFVLVAAFSIESTTGAGAEKRLDPVVFHKKLRHSELLRAEHAKSRPSRRSFMELSGAEGGIKHRSTIHSDVHVAATAHVARTRQPVAAAAPSPAAAGPVSAERLSETISNAAETAGEVLHNTEVERDMLQTQLLANGEGLHVIKKLAETVAKMKNQVETLENHERVCQKKLADMRAGQNQVEEDNALANTVADEAP